MDGAPPRRGPLLAELPASATVAARRWEVAHRLLVLALRPQPLDPVEGAVG